MELEKIINPEDIRDVAQVKRVLEFMGLFSDFKERFDKNPLEAMASIGLPELTIEDVSFRKKSDTEEGIVAIYDSPKAKKYAAFMDKKFEFKNRLIEDCAPSNPAMKKWRQRQVNRCIMELGGRSRGMIHAPLLIEIADGCSVGCEFCGLNAGRLKSVFRYTDENARLFRDVLRISKEIIGPAAGKGTMYFATEPLDNPDYELLLDDFYREFGELPQITTAASTRNLDRTRKFLEQLNKDGRNIYRFSLTSREMAERIVKEFTPEEVVLVELLPQFEEAPLNCFVNSGRNADKNDDFGETISCLSGFRVNMCRKEIILETPIYASDKYPTGEVFVDRCNFTDAADYKEKLTGMISKNMLNIIGPNEKVMIRENETYTITEDNVIIFDSGNESQVKFKMTGKLSLVKIIVRLLEERPMTKREIVNKLIEMDECSIAEASAMHFLINRLWEFGIIKKENGAI